MAQSSGRTGVIIVVVLPVVVAGLAALHYRTKQRVQEETIVVARPSATPAGPAASAKPAPSATGPVAQPSPIATPDLLTELGPLTAADIPQTVTLLKPEEIKYRKGGIFTAKGGARLLFVTQYVRDAKTGERFEILDYNPVERKVFLKAQADNGQVIALNTLDLQGTCDQPEPVPANTVVACLGVADGNVVVAYQGDRIVVPPEETDIVQQVNKRRAAGAGP